MSVHYRTTVGLSSWSEMVPTQPDMNGIVPFRGNYEIELISTAANKDCIFWTWKIKVLDKDEEQD